MQDKSQHHALTQPQKAYDVLIRYNIIQESCTQQEKKRIQKYEQETAAFIIHHQLTHTFAALGPVLRGCVY